MYNRGIPSIGMYLDTYRQNLLLGTRVSILNVIIRSYGYFRTVFANLVSKLRVAYKLLLDDKDHTERHRIVSDCEEVGFER